MQPAPQFTLEERARLGDDEALRRYFDARNISNLRWLSILMILTAAGITIWTLAAREWWRITPALIAFLAAFLTNRALPGEKRRRPRLELIAKLRRLIVGRTRTWTIVFLPLFHLFILTALFDLQGSLAITFLYAYLIVAIRLQPVESLVVYGTMAALLIAEGTIAGRNMVTGSDPVLPSTINVGIAFAINLWVARKSRRGFISEWRGGRGSAREQLRMREELDFARDVQLSMLPRQPPSHDWLEIASLSLPATEVGGDYYDFFDLGEGKLAVVIGDVAGHGLASGMVLSGIRSCLTLLCDELVQPAAVMEKLDRMLRQTTAHRMFMTLSILLLDRSGPAILSSAGHPPLFLERDGKVEMIETHALPLGTRLATQIDQKTFQIRSGDLLILQTDGVYETVSAWGESYGFDRFADAIMASPKKTTIHQRRDALLRDLWMFRGDAIQRDDVTLVLIRIR
ncbi:MAG TPA: PP2C family protein-serine/threonine phosphatase [Thermoanaerobaculia bacterium]|nr:PP2C family protein-serine/threonine phosphatase [Thermoanaerobaculia bacterium]